MGKNSHDWKTLTCRGPRGTDSKSHAGIRVSRLREAWKLFTVNIEQLYRDIGDPDKSTTQHRLKLLVKQNKVYTAELNKIWWNLSKNATEKPWQNWKTETDKSNKIRTRQWLTIISNWLRGKISWRHVILTEICQSSHTESSMWTMIRLYVQGQLEIPAFLLVHPRHLLCILP